MFFDGSMIISKWKLSEEELEEVRRTGCVWFMQPGQQPTFPIQITGIMPLRPSEELEPELPKELTKVDTKKVPPLYTAVLEYFKQKMDGAQINDIEKAATEFFHFQEAKEWKTKAQQLTKDWGPTASRWIKALGEGGAK